METGTQCLAMAACLHDARRRVPCAQATRRTKVPPPTQVVLTGVPDPMPSPRLRALFGALLIWLGVATLDAAPMPIPDLPSAPIPTTFDAVVSPTKDARFTTLQAAIDAAPDNATKPYVILIKPGRYRWQQTLIPATKRFIHLVGENAATTTLSYHLNVFETMKDRRIERLEGISVIVLADDFQATNLTIENTSGDHGQALALRIDGDRAALRNCRLLGWQDTLMVNTGRQYFRDCYIEGRVDFIFGSGNTVFDHCELRSKAGGYVTAASTPAEQAFGFTFLDCRLTGDPTPWEPDQRSRPALLGRPWRPHAAVAFIRCEMGAHIAPAGWNNWGKAENEQTARYVEFGTTGPGANPSGRVSWARTLTDEKAQRYTLATVFAGPDSWAP